MWWDASARAHCKQKRHLFCIWLCKKELTKILPHQATNSVAYSLSGSVLVYCTGTLTVVSSIRRPINIVGYGCRVTGLCLAKIV